MVGELDCRAGMLGEARLVLPDDVDLTATFGNPGEGGYKEMWRTPSGRRFEISNGSYLESAPFTWQLKEIVV